MSNVDTANLCYLSYNYHSIIRTTVCQVCMCLSSSRLSYLLLLLLLRLICTYSRTVSSSPFILICITNDMYIYLYVDIKIFQKKKKVGFSIRYLSLIEFRVSNFHLIVLIEQQIESGKDYLYQKIY
jgi:hypothetical protein